MCGVSARGPWRFREVGADSDSAGGMGEAHRPASRTGVEAGAPLGRPPCRGHWGLSPPLPSGEKRPPVIPQKPSLGKIQARRGRRATSDTVPGSRGLRPIPAETPPPAVLPMRGARRGSLLLIKSDLIITASPRGAASISGGDAGAGAQKRPRQPADFRLPRGAIPSLRAISEEAGSRPPGCRCFGKVRV